METVVVVRRGLRALLYVLFLSILGAWLFLPGSNALPILREWMTVVWVTLHATRLGPYLPAMDLSLASASLLTVTSAAIYTRVVLIAWRSYAFIRRRKKAALRRAGAAAA